MKKLAEYILNLPMDIKKKNVEDPKHKGTGYRKGDLYEGVGVFVYDPVSSDQALHNFCSQMDLSTHHRLVLNFNCTSTQQITCISYFIIRLYLTESYLSIF